MTRWGWGGRAGRVGGGGERIRVPMKHRALVGNTVGKPGNVTWAEDSGDWGIHLDIQYIQFPLLTP